MIYLQKTWIRILFSLLGGGLISEIIHISTGDPNRPSTSGESYRAIIFSIIIFYILTNVANKLKK